MCQLDYIAFQTPQMEAMQNFYQVQMGLTLVKDFPAEQGSFLLGPGRRIWLQKARVKGTTKQTLQTETSGQAREQTQSEGRLLAEVGFRVFESRWPEAQVKLLQIGAMPVLAHPVFEQALRIQDPEGNNLVFGVGSRLGAMQQNKRDAFSGGKRLTARLQHFGLGTACFDKLHQFYANEVGFAVSDEVFGDDGLMHSSFVRGTGEHHILALFDNNKPGFDHMSFETDSWNGIRDWADHFASFGTKIFWGAGRHGVGNNLFVFVEDPDKHWVEISAELETVPLGRAPGRWAFDYKAYNLWGAAAGRV